MFPPNFGGGVDGIFRCLDYGRIFSQSSLVKPHFPLLNLHSYEHMFSLTFLLGVFKGNRRYRNFLLLKHCRHDDTNHSDRVASWQSPESIPHPKPEFAFQDVPARDLGYRDPIRRSCPGIAFKEPQSKDPRAGDPFREPVPRDLSLRIAPLGYVPGIISQGSRSGKPLRAA